MCMPSPPSQVAPASPVPSMQAADNLQIGGAGAPRGAAQLGRLALRFGGSPSSSASPATSGAAAQQATAAPSVPSAFTPAAEAQQPGVGTTPGSLAGLRFGNFNTAFA